MPTDNAGTRPQSITFTPEQLAALHDDELSKIDVVVLNLTVACQFPTLKELPISRFQWIVDKWAARAKKFLVKREPDFHRSASTWRNDIRFFRIAVLCLMPST